MSQSGRENMARMREPRFGFGREIAYGDLQKTACPQPNNSRTPLPHVDVFDNFKHIIELQDHVKIVNPIFVVSSERGIVPNVFMARFDIEKVVPWGGGIADHYGVSSDYRFQGAITNSYDNSFGTCCYFGTKVCVCANGAWVIKTKMKDSSRVLANSTMEDFGTMVWNISCELDDIYNNVVSGFEALRELDFSSRREVHAFVLQSVQIGVLDIQETAMVLRHWNEPEHAEFRDRNGYSLFNAYTSHWRDSDQFMLPDKTMRLKKFMSEFKQTIRINNTRERSQVGLVRH